MLDRLFDDPPTVPRLAAFVDVPECLFSEKADEDEDDMKDDDGKDDGDEDEEEDDDD